ncbi:MAG: RagB/SusD family nutrient uptake outer membrane protein [Bacteroidetes bacterium]|nr:RagB/SusD family nutrient uptake outer membrane protein [Bacteroidota bacterium]
MKNLLLNISLVLTFILVTTSCDSWIDGVGQTTTVSDEIIWDDETSVDLYINGFYTYLDKYGQFGSNQFSGSLTESLTETFKYGSYALGDRAGHSNNYVFNPEAITSAGCRYSVWSTAYENIRRINQFLALQQQYSKFSDEKNVLWEAQARFFRAFVYFQLAKRHGGVILYTDLDMSNDKARSTEAETWELIAQDLDYAAEHLPVAWNSENTNRITKGAAFAFKSRAMLYAERWQDAYNAADSVIALNIYGLVDDYEQSWKGQNKESILEFDYAISGPYHTFDKYYVPFCDGYEYGALGTPTQEMVEAYEKSDGTTVDWTPWHTTTTTPPPYDELEPRFKATVIYRGSSWKGRVMDCSVNGENGEFMAYREQPYSYGKTTTGYFLKKLLDESLTDVKGTNSTQPWVEIRYAEVLLNKAEAAYHLSGKIGEAQAAMNQVRARTGVNLPPKSSTGEAWFKDYRNERKVELAYEGHLFWDMRRWKLADTEYTGYRVHGFKITGSTYEYIDCDYQDRRFLKKLYVLPIPDDELTNNSLIEQYDEWK